jgi:hypothetical protein
MAIDIHHRAGSWSRSGRVRGEIGVRAVATTRPAAARAGAGVGATIRVTHQTVAPGATVTITGEAPRDARPGSWITIQSDAWRSSYRYRGIPATRTQVLPDGTYRATARVRTGVTATTFAIVGNFDGVAFPGVAWLHVGVRPTTTVAAARRAARQLSAGRAASRRGAGRQRSAGEQGRRRAARASSAVEGPATAGGKRALLG